MKRIDGPGATPDNRFTEGDPARGIPATTVKADWLNNVQEELGSFIESRCIALDGDDTTQLQQALISLLGLKTTIQIRSEDPVIWNGARFSFTKDIQLIFREQEDTIVNIISRTISPISLEDGQVFVLRLDKFRTPVTLTFQPNYNDLEAGQYSIINEGNLSNEQPEEETILFRRRGTDLEIPILGEIYVAGAVFKFGQLRKHNHQNDLEGGNLDTSAITTGQFADARISQSNVTQHQGAIDHNRISNRGANTHPQIDAHINNRNNPHGVTLAQVGGTTDHGALSGRGDDDHPQYLHLNKIAQTIRQDLFLAAGIKVDGVDISSHTHQISLLRFYTNRGQQVRNTSIDVVLTVGGFTDFAFATCSIIMIDMTQGGGGFDGDNRAQIGGTADQTFGRFHSPDIPRRSGNGNYEFRVRQSAGNEDVVCCYSYGVLETFMKTWGPS